MVGRSLVVVAVAFAGCASPLGGGEGDMASGAPELDFAVAPDDLACIGLRCDGGCVDPDNDPANCSACGLACGKGQACVNGACTCDPNNCAGCCMGSQCLAGDADDACGAGGIQCQPCQTRCINGGCSGCVPNSVDTQPCGNCGTMTRTCDMNGVWGAFGGCTGEGVCMPNATRKVACGNCGTETDTCSPKCQWQAGACSGQGACAPGATRAGNCDPCSHEVCGMNCQWGACTLQPGNACEWRMGTHTRPCMCGQACGGQALQWCLQSCQWSNACACCTNQCVNC